MGRERGLTVPRLNGLFKASARRRRDELREQAQVLAIAFHEPKEINETFKPTLDDTAYRAARDPDEWDQDEWWTDQSSTVEE